MAVFGEYDQAGLDREYDNRAKVADAAEQISAWEAGGAEARAQLSCDLDITYGPQDRQKLDIFPTAKRGAPTLAFIHGGYWHRNDKSHAHFLAPGFVAAEVNFVALGYRLCPEVTVADIVEDIRAGLIWTAENADQFGGDGREVYVAGHSAGGHLAAMMCGPDGVGKSVVKGGCSISGLHDLEAIRMTYLNDQLHMDQEMAHRLSPIALAEEMSVAKGELPPLMLTVGGDEGPEYLRQRDQLGERLREKGQPVDIVDVPGHNHFTILSAFGNPTHPLGEAMLRLIFAPSF